MDASPLRARHFPGGSPLSPDALPLDLLPGERVLWTGQPDPKAVFHRSDKLMIPLSLMWGGFALFWEFGTTDGRPLQHGDWFSALWGILFVVMGQYMIWGRFFYQAWRKRRTWYAITSKRIAVVNLRPQRRELTSFLVSITSVAVSTEASGIGTIEFSPEPQTLTIFGSRSRDNPNTFSDINLSRLVFYDIADAREVANLLQGELASLAATRA